MGKQAAPRRKKKAQPVGRSALELLRAIVDAADKKPGGDTPTQEIPKDLICDVRVFLREYAVNARIATRALGGA